MKIMDNIWQPIHVWIPSRFFINMPISSLKCYKKKNHMENFPNLHMALCIITPTNNNQLEKKPSRINKQWKQHKFKTKQPRIISIIYIYIYNPLSSMNFLFYFNYNILRCQKVIQVFTVQITPNININKPFFYNEHQGIQIFNPQPKSS